MDIFKFQRTLALGFVCAQWFAGSAFADEEKASSTTGKPASEGRSSTPDYSMEVIGSIDFINTSGSLKSSDGSTTNTKTASSELDAAVSFGYLLGDHAEPFIEYGYQSQNGKVSEAQTTNSSSNTSTSWGLGMLFNLPPAATVKHPGGNAPLFSQSTLIPYGGIALTNAALNGKQGLGGLDRTKNTDTVTKIIGGLRYIPFPHLAMHFQTRISQQQSSSEADSSGTLGGTTSKTTIEAHLFSLSFLF